MTGATFRQWRERLGLNRIDAAEQLGVHRNSITNWERETNPLPRWVALACAAIAYGLEPMP